MGGKKPKQFLCLVFQTSVNNVPFASFMETQYGVIIVLLDVLKVQHNRCSKPVTVQLNVSLKQQAFLIITS